MFTVFRNSRFFISVCLVTSFVVFIVIPDIIMASITVQKEAHKLKAKNLVTAFIYYGACASDVYIYVFGNTSIKMLLYRKLRTIRCIENIVPNTPHQVKRKNALSI